MNYSGQYITYTRDELLALVAKQMSRKRFQHVLGVEEAAIELAIKYHVDVEKASIAALVHDYAKEKSDEAFKHYLDTRHYPADLEKYGNQIWHGIIGADMIEAELGLLDQEILDAVRFHTTGSANMSELAQVIYVADYIEPNRVFPGVEEAREKAKQSLAAAVAFETKQTLNYLIQQEVLIYPKTLETYNAWVAHI